MSLIGSIGGITSPYTAAPGLIRTDSPVGPVKTPGVAIPSSTPETQPSQGFGNVIGRMISTVDAKQDAAQAVTRDVLLGKNDNLHQSMIAMQEAGVAFQLMVEVRNKVVESYQELMRMPV